MFFQVDYADVVRRVNKFFGDKADAEVGFDHGQYLVCGVGFNVWQIRNAVVGKKLGVKFK